jgi:hypothetical protein
MAAAAKSQQAKTQQQTKEKDKAKHGTHQTTTTQALLDSIASEFGSLQRQKRQQAQQGQRPGTTTEQEEREATTRLVWKIPTDTPSNAFQQRWDKLPVIQANRCTKDYRILQRKLLILAPFAASERGAELDKLQQTYDWSAGTTFSRWRAFLGALKELGEPIGVVERAIEELWRGKSEEELEVDPVQPMTIAQLDLWIKTSPPVSVQLWIRTAFLYGQRPSDIAQLTTDMVSIVDQYVVLTIVHGKTMHRATTPYTLHLQIRSPLAKDILKRTMELPWEARLWQEADHFDLLRSLRRVDRELETRSIRRGGLQRLAAIGLTTSELLRLSRHTTETSLMRYLNWGKFHLQPAAQTARVNKDF